MAQRHQGGRQGRPVDAPGGGPGPAARPDRVAVLRQHIVRLADKAPGSQHLPEAEEQLELLSQALKRDLVAYEDQILQITLECTWELPHKLPYYAALLGLLNVADYNFVQRAVEAIHAALQAGLLRGDPLIVRLGLRILATLAGSLVASPAGVLRAFHALVTDAVASLDTAPAWQARGDWYVYAVLGALPWGGKELQRGAPAALAELLDLAATYCQHRDHLATPALHAQRTLPDGTPAANAPDYVEALQAAIAALAQDTTWTVKSIPRPQEHFAARLQSAEPHSVASLVLPPLPAAPPDLPPLAAAHVRWTALAAYPPEVPSLRIFPAAKTDEGLSAVDRWVVEQCCLDVLRAFNGARKECTIALATLPLPFRHEYITAEAVFSQMLALPAPPFRLVFYGVVLMDLCKALPAAFPAVVAQAIKALYARLPQLDVEARARLAHWMAHHLSNFGFTWGWDEWAPALALPAWHPQRRFCAAVLERAVRLAYWDKLRETLPDALQPLMPPRPLPGVPPADAEGGGDAAGLAQQLTALVREKKSSKEVSAWLDAAVVPGVGLHGALGLVAPTLLGIGAKTLTHMVTMLERYQPLLARLAPDRPAQAHLVALAADFWAAFPQMACICIDRLMAFRLVSNLAIADWAFSLPLLPTLHTSDLAWEVLGRALSQTGHRAADLAASLAEAHTSVAATKEEAARLAVAVGLEAEGAAARAQEAAVAAEEAAEVKAALHARAVQEQESLLVTVLDHLAAAVAHRQQALAHAPPEGSPAEASRPAPQQGEPAGEAMDEAGPAPQPDADAEEAPAHAAEAEAGEPRDGQPSSMEVDVVAPAEGTEADSASGAAAEPSAREEGEAWVAALLEHLRAIVRQHAHQLWPLVVQHKLDVLTRGDLPSEVRQEIGRGLCCPEGGSAEDWL